MAVRDDAQRVEEEYQKRLKAGEVVQLYHPTKGIRYHENNENALMWAERRGWVPVEYEEEVVKTPKPVPAKPKGKGKEAKSKAKEG